MSHLYLDSMGNVTCGIGHLVWTRGDPVTRGWMAALKIPFAPQITAPEFVALCAAEPDRLASFYAPMTKGRLTDAQMDAILDADIAEAQRNLATEFPGCENWPSGASAAGTDLVYNLGTSGLTKGFPRLTAAMRAQDWLTCAAECHRQGISEARNAATKELFLQVAKGAA